MNVLVVEDEQACRELIVRTLTPYCVNIWEVSTLSEAIRYSVAMALLHVIVLDLRLPDAPDGKRTIMEIPNFKQAHPEAAVMVITGIGDSQESKAECLAAGADVFAPKDDTLLRKNALLTSFLQLLEKRKTERPDIPEYSHCIEALRNFLQPVS